MNKLQAAEIRHVTWPTMLPDFITATAYGSEMFPSSLLRFNPSSTTGVHTSLYMWCPRMQRSNSNDILIDAIFGSYTYTRVETCLDYMGFRKIIIRKVF